MFGLAISILLLAEPAPSSLPTTASDAGSILGSTDTAPAATTGPLEKLAAGPSTDATGPRIAPTTSASTQVSIAAEPGKPETIKGAFTKVDPNAKTVTVKTDAGADETVYVTATTAITIDNKAADWGALAAVDSAQLTIIAGPGKVATSISAETPSWLMKLGKSNPLLLMILPLGLFLLLSVRNKRKQEKAQQERLGSIKRGDRIQTIGGIIGNVVQTEEGRVLVKVDESNNTKIWFARSAVGRVLGEEKSSDAKTTK